MIKSLLKNPLISLSLVLLLLLQVTLLFISRYTVWPEMILYPYLMNNGFALYKDIVNPYFPLLSNILSFYFSIFGLSIFNLKILTYIIILVTNLAIFWSSWKLSKNLGKAFLSSFLYLVLQYTYGGNGLWFELMLSPFVILGSTLIFLDSKSKKNLILSGLLLALGILIKQNAALFFLAAIYLLFIRRVRGQIVYFLFPGIILGAMTLFYLMTGNLWGDFYNWAILLPMRFSTQHGFISLPAIRQYPLILFPAISILALSKIQKSLSERLYWILCFLIALSFAFPRYEDFHLQVLIGLSAVFAGLLNKKILIVFTIIVLVLFIRTANKLIFQPDRFLDSDTISLAGKAKEYQSIYLLNSPDLVYFLADKLPSKPWAINFPWYFENYDFENKFIDGLNSQKPEAIIIGDPLGGGKYSLGNYFPQNLLNYIQKNYHKKERFKNFWIWQRN